MIAEIFSAIGTIFGSLQLMNIFAAFIPYKIRREKRANNVKCVIVTVGNEKVINSLREVVSQFERLNLDYVIVSSNPLPFENVIVVPKEEDGSKFRAIKYFVKNFVRDDCWYVFFDDDSYPLDDGFLYDIAYFSEKDSRYAIGNGILKPRMGKSKLAYALDWIRYFDDLTRFKLAALLGKPVYGLHGELLIVRGDVLREIWLNMEESITEDFNFAMHTMKRGYKFFQVKTIVSIKSPNSVKDFIKQRRRWANVIFDALRHKNLLVPIYALTGVMISPLFLPIWFMLHSIVAFAAGLYYWFVYAFGGVKARLWYAPAILFASALEAIGMLSGIVKRDKKFVVIDKS
jgi:cellulose synthase/poly-beta-1,6-N-acetylglucosamine synthase-like glycosyltransferase